MRCQQTEPDQREALERYHTDFNYFGRQINSIPNLFTVLFKQPRYQGPGRVKQKLYFIKRVDKG